MTLILTSGDSSYKNFLNFSQLFNKYDYLILVGGSGLYIDAICNGLDKIPTINKEIRESINEEFDKKGLEWLQKKIFEIDADFFKKTDIKNPQRLKRCLEVFKGTGNKLSSKVGVNQTLSGIAMSLA